MTSLKLRHSLPAFAAACVLSLAAPAAMAQSTMAPSSTMSPMKPAATKTAPVASFSTVAAAKASCPADTVVWSTLSKSKSFHLASSKYYGKTKHGAYLCEKTATAAGYHPSKS
jgi:hypothetical protein